MNEIELDTLKTDIKSNPSKSRTPITDRAVNNLETNNFSRKSSFISQKSSNS